MSRRRSSRRVGRRPALLGLLALLLALLAPPTAARAHSLDEYLQATYITVAPTEILVELNLSPGVLLMAEVLPKLDPDGNGEITDAEGRVYVDAVLRQVVLEVDGAPLPLTVTGIELTPYLNFQTGYGTLKVAATAALPEGLTGAHRIVYTNNHVPTGAVYQVNAFVNNSAAIDLGKQNRDTIQQSMTVDYAIGGAVPSAAPMAAASAAGESSAAPAAASTSAAATTAAPNTSGETVAGAPEQARRLLAYVQAPVLSPLALVLGLALAAVLGGLHALTPGHGKTLVAAYLIGSRGTVRDAFVLGGTVTLTHTASVLAFGALALLAGQVVATTMLAAVLELCAALLVAGLGARLVWDRWRALRTAAQGSHLGHAHPHPHGAAARPAGLIGFGVAGGALPCPEALAILLVAVGLGRVGLGFGLIVSFSLGLAAVLIALGVLLVRAEGRLSGWTRLGGAWQRWLPLASAVIVTLLGSAMLANVYRRATLPSSAWLLVAAAIAVFASGYGLAMLVQRRRLVAAQAAPQGTATPLPAAWLPARYGNRAANPAPMGAAELRFDATGAVAWDTMWTDFCDLALAGGPPHRGTLLEAPSPEQVHGDPAGYRRAQAELARGLRMVTELPIVTTAAAGWIGLRCDDEDMALWMLRAIVVENMAVRREGQVLLVPCGPDFRVAHEIKNVVTVVAKTFHYWREHRGSSMRAEDL